MATEDRAVVQPVEDHAIWFIPNVVDEILLRLPASSLLRFRRVCKQWCNIINNPRFIREHALRASKDLLLFLPKFDISAGHRKNYEPSRAVIVNEKWSPSTWAASHLDPDDRLFASCNGLLCFYKAYKLKIVNPATGEDKWRDIRTPKKCCMVNLGVVNVDGAMYWLAEDEGTSSGMSVVSFDLREETFTSIQLPPLSEGKRIVSFSTPAFAYYMTEIENTVCIIATPYQSHIPRWRHYSVELSGGMFIWALESLVEHKWFLKYSIQSTNEPQYIPQPCFINWNKILLQDPNGSAWYHDLRGKNVQIEQREEAKLLDLGAHRFYETESYFYKATLVSLSEYAGAAIVRALPPPVG